MKKQTAGILLFRRAQQLEVFLVHPGGPYWEHKDTGAWSIPKGEPHPEEDFLAAALRELKEETGFEVDGKFIPLPAVRLPSGKTVSAWAIEQEADPGQLVSNTCMVEWPPRSGKQIEIPEVDRGEWFTLEMAEVKIQPGQLPLLQALPEILRR